MPLYSCESEGPDGQPRKYRCVAPDSERARELLEYLEGMDLGELLHEEGPLDIARTVHVLSQVCDAVDAAAPRRRPPRGDE